MAQLKLMKKEWFDWFKNTTLENITAWTEYYYINPDSQHWISNYQIWDEEWELGSIDSNGNNESNSQRIRSINYIQVEPNGNYYFLNNTGVPIQVAFYDINKSFVSFLDGGIPTSRVFTIPNNCFYIRFRTNNGVTTYNHDICINVSNPTFNGKYEPRIIKIEDILGVVDLGDLNWIYTSEGDLSRFYTSDLMDIIRKPLNYNTKGKIFNDEYKILSSWNDFISQASNNISIRSDGIVSIRDLNYTNAVVFKNSLKGKYLIYIKVDSPL